MPIHFFLWKRWPISKTTQLVRVSFVSLIAVGENKAANDQRMVEYFNSLSPTCKRSLKSFTCRWAEIQASFKCNPHCKLFTYTGIFQTSTRVLFLAPQEEKAGGFLIKRNRSKAWGNVWYF